MAETITTLMTKAKRSLAAARRAGDADAACRHAFQAALLAARAIGLATGSALAGRTLGEVVSRMSRHELLAAARALDTCALQGSGKSPDSPGRLQIVPADATFELRGGLFHAEQGALAVFCATQFVTRATTICAAAAR